MQSDWPSNKCWEMDHDFNGTAERNPYIKLLVVRDYTAAGAGRAPWLLTACQSVQTNGDRWARRQVFVRAITLFPTPNANFLP